MNDLVYKMTKEGIYKFGNKSYYLNTLNYYTFSIIKVEGVPVYLIKDNHGRIVKPLNENINERTN